MNIFSLNSKFAAVEPGNGGGGADLIFTELENIAAPNFRGASIGDIVSALLPYIFAIAGFLLILYLLYGGYQFMLSGGNPKSMQQGKDVITRALVGFAIIFVAFWLTQIVARMLGLQTIITIF